MWLVVASGRAERVSSGRSVRFLSGVARGDQEESVREKKGASALRDGCLCICLLKHDQARQGQEPSQPYDMSPQNRANTRHRAKAISAAISRNHISWQYKRSGRLLRDAILGRFEF